MNPDKHCMCAGDHNHNPGKCENLATGNDGFCDKCRALIHKNA